MYSNIFYSDSRKGGKTYLDPGLSGHLALLDLVANDRAASIILWSLPCEVHMVSGDLRNLEVLGCTWRCCKDEKEGREKSYTIINCYETLPV